ncbi:SulP family inorganic anion transporter [Mycobacterium sp. URHD0025]|uniref:SulP family inorganic anion transporter n=1 Tax=Mycobacterium sp. URHD0025 TaxID=1298864 RepID=UPI000688BC30|nr:SulP family inorganic anion transporter [Mycobacterium sp. URHD0025]
MGDTANVRVPGIVPYQRQWLRADVVAGLAAGAVIIPQAMAYATVAHMPVQFGLYTCMLPLVVYAFIGGSRTTSVTTTSTIATLSASTMVGAGIAAGSPDAQAHLITLTMLVGAFLLAARLLRLGAIIENINEATLLGLKVGVGVTVAASQLPKLFGVEDDPHATGFFHILWSVLRHIGQLNIPTVLLSIVTITLLLLIGKFAPLVPGPLVVVVLGIVLAAFGGLPSMGVALIPEVPQGIPLPALPALDHVGQLIPGALAIAMMAFLETVAVARSVRRPEEPQIDADRELSANGVAALVSSFFHTLPPAGGFSQTGMNLRTGARTQVCGLVTAALAVLVAVLLAPVLSKLPQATLGAMVLVAVLGLIDIGALQRLYRFDKLEFSLAAIVGVFGLTVGLLPAVAAGVLLTLYFVLREANRAHVVQVNAHPLVLRFELGLYTANLRANIDAVAALVAACDPQPDAVVLDLSRLPWLSSTILDGLRDLETGMHGVEVRYAGLRDDLHRAALRWPWWQDVERQGRYLGTTGDDVGSPGR